MGQAWHWQPLSPVTWWITGFKSYLVSLTPKYFVTIPQMLYSSASKRWLIVISDNPEMKLLVSHNHNCIFGLLYKQTNKQQKLHKKPRGGGKYPQTKIQTNQQAKLTKQTNKHPQQLQKKPVRHNRKTDGNPKNSVIRECRKVGIVIFILECKQTLDCMSLNIGVLDPWPHCVLADLQNPRWNKTRAVSLDLSQSIEDSSCYATKFKVERTWDPCKKKFISIKQQKP